MSINKTVHVYFMPGMSANSLIFEKIKLSSKYKLHLLEWIDPLKNETLKDYSIRTESNLAALQNAARPEYKG